MDPILAVIAILLFTIIIPTLLATLTLKTYLYGLGLVILGYVSYLWLLENLTPSPSASRLTAGYGLIQVYPKAEDIDRDHAADEASTTYVSEILRRGSPTIEMYTDGIHLGSFSSMDSAQIPPKLGQLTPTKRPHVVG